MLLAVLVQYALAVPVAVSEVATVHENAAFFVLVPLAVTRVEVLHVLDELALVSDVLVRIVRHQLIVLELLQNRLLFVLEDAEFRRKVVFIANEQSLVVREILVKTPNIEQLSGCRHFREDMAMKGKGFDDGDDHSIPVASIVAVLCFWINVNADAVSRSVIQESVKHHAVVKIIHNAQAVHHSLPERNVSNDIRLFKAEIRPATEFSVPPCAPQRIIFVGTLEIHYTVPNLHGPGNEHINMIHFKLMQQPIGNDV